MSEPYVAGGLSGVDTAPPVQGPPQDTPLVQRVAEVLLAAYAVNKTVELIAFLLSPFGISRKAVRVALGLITDGGGPHQPNARLAANGITPSRAAGSPAALARTVARADVYFRAAYLIAAVRRIQASLGRGRSAADAINAERRNLDAHRRARRKRLDAVAEVAKAREVHGPMLGWYRDPASDSDPDCRVADGHNFYADEGTSIGYPGAVHPQCRCVPGPPHADGLMVDDALTIVLGRMSTATARERLVGRRRAS